MFSYKAIVLWLFLAISLGLAPYFPEPHIYQKIILMGDPSFTFALIDWFDLGLHSLPWIGLMICFYNWVKHKCT